MKIIPLTKGQFALVDEADFKRFGHMKWCASKNTNGFYAKRGSGYRPQKTVYLAREILGVTDPLVKVDHKNHDTLDCRRRNLRACTHAQNMRNRSGVAANNKSGSRGVYWEQERRKWRAQIGTGGKTINIGRFDKKDVAIRAYAKANRKYFNKFGGNLT